MTIDINIQNFLLLLFGPNVQETETEFTDVLLKYICIFIK